MELLKLAFIVFLAVQSCTCYPNPQNGNVRQNSYPGNFNQNDLNPGDSGFGSIGGIQSSSASSSSGTHFVQGNRRPLIGR